jgi:hypothetical protein
MRIEHPPDVWIKRILYNDPRKHHRASNVATRIKASVAACPFHGRVSQPPVKTGFELRPQFFPYHADLPDAYRRRRITVLVGSIFRWQEVLPLVIVYATEIAAINPSAARFALMEMFDFVPMRICIFGNVFTARNLHSSLFQFRSPGVLSSTSFSQMPDSRKLPHFE